MVTLHPGENFEKAAHALGFAVVDIPEPVSTSEESIRFLVKHMAAAGLIMPEEAQLAEQAVLKRELLGSTRVHDFALPRGRNSSVERVIGVLGRSKVGLAWDAPSAPTVTQVCLIIAPPSRPKDHFDAIQRMHAAATAGH